MLGHEYIILDTNADATQLRRQQQIVRREIQARFDCENHARRDLRALIRLVAGLRAIMHVKPQMVRNTASKPTTMLLSLRGQGFLDGDLQNAPLVQALGDHAHARMMDIRIRGTRLRGFETGLLGVQHRLIQLALQGRELAVHREGTGDVRRVQAIDLDTSIDEQQFAVADHAGVAHPMQDRRMLARGDNRVIADGVALLACHRIERALQHALGTRAADHARQMGEHTVETVLRGLDSLADLADFV